MSNTRPGEMQRIKELAGNDPYRVEMLVNIATLVERSEHATQWMKEHDARDEKRFEDLESKVNRVSSSVGGLQTDRANVMTLKDAAMVLAKFAGVVIAAGWAVWLTFFRGHP